MEQDVKNTEKKDRVNPFIPTVKIDEGSSVQVKISEALQKAREEFKGKVNIKFSNELTTEANNLILKQQEFETGKRSEGVSDNAIQDMINLAREKANLEEYKSQAKPRPQGTYTKSSGVKNEDLMEKIVALQTQMEQILNINTQVLDFLKLEKEEKMSLADDKFEKMRIENEQNEARNYQR